MLEASNLEEIEIQEGEESVRLVKNKTHGTIRNDVEITKEIGVGKENKQETLEEELGDKITSPMVGTFYSAPSPGAKPFISVGDEIQEGDIVCIVEAMKMMNEIKSDFSGKVSSILVENAEPVEFGQGLFLIK